MGAAITLIFTCVTPFAAFAVIAAATMSRRDAVTLTVALWLANQAVGFALLHYPWSSSTAAWGIALGAGAMIATLAAVSAVARLGSLPPLARSAVAFAASFVLYQLALYAAAASRLGGTEMFVPGIVSQALVINAVTLGGLFALRRVVAAGATLLARRGDASLAPIV
jgi:hypothetical protein